MKTFVVFGFFYLGMWLKAKGFCNRMYWSTSLITFLARMKLVRSLRMVRLAKFSNLLRSVCLSLLLVFVWWWFSLVTLIRDFYKELFCFTVSIWRRFVWACSFFFFFLLLPTCFVFLNILIEESLDMEETCWSRHWSWLKIFLV